MVLSDCRDLAMPKFQWDAPMLPSGAAVPFSSKEIERCVSVAADPYQAGQPPPYCSNLLIIPYTPDMCHDCCQALAMSLHIVCHVSSRFRARQCRRVA